MEPMSTDDTRDRPGPADPDPVRCTVFVRGHVQGVGFRWWTRARALELGLTGWARNTADGRVEVVAEGPRATVERLVGLLREDLVGGGAVVVVGGRPPGPRHVGVRPAVGRDQGRVQLPRALTPRPCFPDFSGQRPPDTPRTGPRPRTAA